MRKGGREGIERERENSFKKDRDMRESEKKSERNMQKRTEINDTHT